MELVGVNNVMPKVLWGRNFIEAQGCKVEQNIVFHDKLHVADEKGLCLKLKTNNKIAQNKIEINCCPTEKMWVDYLIKPLQGTKFKLMNFPIICDDEVEGQHTAEVGKDAEVSVATPDCIPMTKQILTKTRGYYPLASSQECVEKSLDNRANGIQGYT